jgi:H/ACA ribonucleoprotein complex subunit 2
MYITNSLMVLAGNITPIDVITHLPVLCEDKDIPYIYVPYKEDLGEAGGTKRPTSVILVLLKPGSGTPTLRHAYHSFIHLFT